MKTHHPRTWLRIASTLLVAALAALIASCASPTARQMDVDDGLHPSWPPPPAATRIVHRVNIRGSQMSKPGFFERIGQAITGASGQRLLRPQAIAVFEQTLYIVDQELQGIHVLRADSNKARFIDRVDKKTYFVSPVGIAWCDGRLAVSDSGLKDVFILSPEGKLEGRLQKPGGFARPTGVAFDAPRQRLYVVDTLNHEVVVFDAAGRFLSTFGGPGSEAGKFHYPTYLAVDAQGVLYVTDSLNFRVQILNPEGHYLGEVGQLGNSSGYLAVPKGVGVDAFGHIYVVDSVFSAVQIFNRQGQLLLSFGDIGGATGQFQVPAGLLVTPDNRIFVCDSQNRRVQVFEYVGATP